MQRRETLALAAAAAVAAAASPAPAQPAAGDPARGRELAHRLCASCHLVEPAQRGPVPDGVPSFASIAARPGQTADRIAGALLGPPHPAMPQPPLDQRQARDVAAHILSLAPPR
jgi:mono/diheme cytochrome c family protein